MIPALWRLIGQSPGRWGLPKKKKTRIATKEMGDENPDFHPKVGDSVWYDYNDDWAEATVVKITGKTYSLDVEGAGRVDKVEKESMLPVEYEEEEDGDQEEEEQEDVEDDLREVLDSVDLGMVSFTLAAAGIKTVDDLKSSSDKLLKHAGITAAAQRKALIDAVAEPALASNQILVTFPAGPLGIDINTVDGFIVVTSAKGTAADQGVAVNDRLVKVGPNVLADKLKKTPNDQKCAEVKKIVVSLPRPLNMVFEKEGEIAVEPAHNEEDGGKKKKRWSLFGKSKDKKEDGPLTIDATFVAGPLGLSVTNQPKRNFALCVTKAGGQAAEHGILIDDEIISLNDKDCRGVKSEDFKKLIVGAGRPFKLSVLREELKDGGDDATVDSAADDKKARLAEEKRAIEEVKAKAKLAQEQKKQAAIDEKKRAKEAKEEEAAAKKREKEEEAAAKKNKDNKKDSKKEDKKEEDKKEFKVNQEVWYDNGDDWVEATILELGETLVIELRDTGEEVPDVERDWLAPMEYEGEEGEEEPEEEEEDEADKLASMKVSETDEKAAKVEEAKAKAAAARAKAEKKQAEKRAKEEKEAKAAAKAAAAKEAKKNKSKASGGPQARGGNFGGFHANRAHMKKFQLDKDKAVDHLQRGKAARMSYSAMITFASHHAKKADLMIEEDEDDPSSHFKKKVRKARSKSLEKKGPQLHEGESEYQYLMRKKREEAYEEELRKEEAREEQARLREEKYFEKEEYRRQLEEEYAPQYDEEGYDDEYEEYDD